MNGHGFSEKRKDMRLKAREGAFAVPEFDAGVPGQIIDISMGGLAFRYMANGKRTSGSFLLDILISNDIFYLKKVPVITVSDFYEIDEEMLFSVILMRRCGVRFGDLTQSKVSQLKYFIQHHSNGVI